jgi:hypothetical protein
LDQAVVPVAGAWQEEQAGCEVAVAPGGGGVVVIFEHGRAELVVVRVVPLQEDEPTGRVDQRLRGLAGLEVGECLAAGFRAVVARLGEDFLDGAGPLSVGARGSSWSIRVSPTFPRPVIASRKRGRNEAPWRRSSRRVWSSPLV